MFGGEEFAALKAAGCPVQRPLWASTGVKNPAYPETLYVYGLVGPDTVNTMPLPTLQAAAGAGEVTGATAAEDPSADLDALRAAGIDLEEVTDQLLREGIDAFVVPMNKLLTGIEVKREAIVTGRPPSLEADLPDALEGPVKERLAQAAEQDVVQRLWRKDGTLWAPAGTPELEDRLGWLTIADKLLADLPEIKDFVRAARADGLTDVVLLGMGGSSLAPEVFRRSNPPAEGALRLHVLDSTEPLQVEAVAALIDPATTLFIVSSKSGGTIEPNALLAHFRGLQPDASHFVAVSDPGTSMAQLAEREGFRKTFLSDPEIGGRYSALSPFGIVPAALAGVDVRGGAGGRPGRGGELPPARCQPGPVAGRHARRAGAARARQAHVRRRPAARLLRRLGRAARGRVDRQARARHPADRRRAAGRPVGLRRRPCLPAPARRRRAGPAPRRGRVAPWPRRAMPRSR